MSELYKKIEDLCQAYNITVTKMCRDIKLSRSVLSEFKSGRTKSISDRNIEAIAEYFNVSPDYLTGRDTNRLLIKSDFSELDLKIIESLPSLSDEQKNRITEIIEHPAD